MDLISVYFSPRLNKIATFKISYADKSFNLLGWELIIDGKRNQYPLDCFERQREHLQIFEYELIGYYND